MISATIVKHSTSRQNIPIVSVHAVYQRFILPEVNTHRVFTRNTRSSRAVPISRLISEVRNNPAVPISWGANKPGMQAGEGLDEPSQASARAAWCDAANRAADAAEYLAKIGLHKQVTNRVLEPFVWAHTLITATDWDNFFAQRLHESAQPEIHSLALCIAKAIQGSTPTLLEPRQWHLPYVTQDELEQYGGLTDPKGVLRKLSAARCARISYAPFDGSASVDAEIERYNKLVGSSPIHASPCEHQASPDEYDGHHGRWYDARFHGNFYGWVQFRKLLLGENQQKRRNYE